MTFGQFNEMVRTCRLCRLGETRTHTVCGEGNLDADLMFVAQAPGAVEDREGRMFQGPSGALFFDLLAQSGIGRDAFYMTNLLKCTLPNNRKPRHDEIAACSRYLEAEIARVKPKLLVPLGYYATRALFDRYALEQPAGQLLFGTVFTVGERRIYPLRHPAAALYNPALRSEMAEGYRRIQTLLA